jgi:hypothetical protein
MLPHLIEPERRIEDRLSGTVSPAFIMTIRVGDLRALLETISRCRSELAEVAVRTEEVRKLEEELADLRQANRVLSADVDRLRGLLNTPEVGDFVDAVQREAAHQRVRWGSDHDEGKTPADWFWLIGYLAGKALHALTAGNVEKGLHHVITTAAVLANWHAAVLGKTNMRPGIVPPAEVAGG